MFFSLPPFWSRDGPCFFVCFFSLPPRVLITYMFTQKVIFPFPFLIWLGLMGPFMPQAGGMTWEWKGWDGGSGGGREGNNNNQPTFINNAMRCVFFCYPFFGSWFIEPCLFVRPPPLSPSLYILPLPYLGPSWRAHSIDLWVGRWGQTVGTEVHYRHCCIHAHTTTHTSFIHIDEGREKTKRGNRHG